MDTEIFKQEKIVFRIKPYTTKALAEMYGISSRTMIRWIKPMKKEIGEKRGRYYTVKQVRSILEEFGLPGYIELN